MDFTSFFKHFEIFLRSWHGELSGRLRFLREESDVCRPLSYWLCLWSSLSLTLWRPCLLLMKSLNQICTRNCFSGGFSFANCCSSRKFFWHEFSQFGDLLGEILPSNFLNFSWAGKTIILSQVCKAFHSDQYDKVAFARMGMPPRSHRWWLPTKLQKSEINLCFLIIKREPTTNCNTWRPKSVNVWFRLLGTRSGRGEHFQ